MAVRHGVVVLGLAVLGWADARWAGEVEREIATADGRMLLREIAAHAVKKGRVCPSASAPVPADRKELEGGSGYMSRVGEWRVDADRDAGFACLGFELTTVQHFQLTYTATATGFEARARGHRTEFVIEGHMTERGMDVSRVREVRD